MIGSLGRVFVALGLCLLIAGGLMILLGKTGVQSMPGDFSFGRGNWRVYVPIGTSIVLSIILTLILWMFSARR